MSNNAGCPLFRVDTSIMIGYNLPWSDSPWTVTKCKHAPWGINIWMEGRLVQRGYVLPTITKGKSGSDYRGRHEGSGVVCNVHMGDTCGLTAKVNKDGFEVNPEFQELIRRLKKPIEDYVKGCHSKYGRDRSKRALQAPARTVPVLPGALQRQRVIETSRRAKRQRRGGGNMSASKNKSKPAAGRQLPLGPSIFPVRREL